MVNPTELTAQLGIMGLARSCVQIFNLIKPRLEDFPAALQRIYLEQSQPVRFSDIFFTGAIIFSGNENYR